MAQATRASSLAKATAVTLKPLASLSASAQSYGRRESAGCAGSGRRVNGVPWRTQGKGRRHRLNENTNGLVRQSFPKSHDFTAISQQDIQKVMNKFNNRPRKFLGMKTPN